LESVVVKVSLMSALVEFECLHVILKQIIEDYCKLPDCVACGKERDPDDFEHTICNKHCGCTAHWPGFDAPCCTICNRDEYLSDLQEHNAMFGIGDDD